MGDVVIDGGKRGRGNVRRLVVLVLLAGLGWLVVTWGQSRKRRAIDRRPHVTPGTVSPPASKPAPTEPLDGESAEPVVSGSTDG